MVLFRFKKLLHQFKVMHRVTGYSSSLQVNGDFYGYNNDSGRFMLFNEEFESVSIHPSGDIYILSMNWSTNKHNLYRIKNTWDPAWRSKWYSDHNPQ